MKFVKFILILSIMLLVSSVSAIPTTFTVKDRYIESQGSGGTWVLFIETTDNNIYHIMTHNFFDCYDLNDISSYYNRFSPNTTHTENIENYRLVAYTYV